MLHICMFAHCHSALLVAIFEDNLEDRLSISKMKQTVFHHATVQPFLLLRLQFGMRPDCLQEHNALSCRLMCPKTSVNNRSSQFYAFLMHSSLSSFLLMVGKFKLGIWAACPTSQLRFGREPGAQECHSEPIHLWGTLKTHCFWVSNVTQKTSKICWVSSLILFSWEFTHPRYQQHLEL